MGSPCYGCTERYSGCHAVCPRYHKFVVKNEEKKAKEHQLRKEQYEYRAARKARFGDK